MSDQYFKEIDMDILYREETLAEGNSLHPHSPLCFWADNKDSEIAINFQNLGRYWKKNFFRCAQKAIPKRLLMQVHKFHMGIRDNYIGRKQKVQYQKVL